MYTANADNPHRGWSQASGPEWKAQRPAGCEECEIRHLAICSALKDSEVHNLDSIVWRQKYVAKQILFEEGETADHVFNVAAGTLKLYKMLPDGRCQVTGFLHAGDFLGLSAHGKYSYGAEAVTPVMLCRFKTTELRHLFDEYPQLRDKMLEVANDELAAAQEQILLLGRKTPIERLASFLLMVSSKFQERDLPGNPIDLSMNRNDISDYLGLTIETVSRAFTKLRNQNVIELPESSHVIIKDEDRLRELAEEG